MRTLSESPIAKRVVRKRVIARQTFHANAIKRILVPIDFSQMSLKAISYALAISRRSGATVHLFHVVDTTQYLSPGLLSLAATVRADWNERLRKRLDVLASRYKDNGEIHVCRPREGVAYKQICAFAQNLNADLIVVATHGYDGYRHLLLGSVAERVVQHARCPILVVRQHAPTGNGAQPGGLRLKKILVPTDFSDCAAAAFDYAVELAREFGAELQLLHVINPNAYPFGDEFAALHATRLIREASQLSQKRMRQMLAKQNIRHSMRIEHGLPVREICKAANRDVDLVVASTHGRTGFRHLLIGSVIEHVVRHARCPILVIPARRNSSKNKTLNSR